jgi:CheY-like chemotaxis protein
VKRVGGSEAAIEHEERQLSLFDDKYRRRRILGDLDPKGDYARIDVTDGGKGISPRIVPRIFDPFYTSRRHSGGTGLGLAVVHSVVSSYEGVLYLDTVEGRGTTFSIYLPLIADSGAEREARGDTSKDAGSERVLIVDDDVDVADMLSIGLARIGYEVAVSNDPLEALEAFTEEPQGWDIAVIDRMMPEMDGIELSLMLKSIRSDLKVILCTGFDDGMIELAEEGRSCDLLFVKPVSPQQIAEAIRQLFDK